MIIMLGFSLAWGLCWLDWLPFDLTIMVCSHMDHRALVDVLKWPTRSLPVLLIKGLMVSILWHSGDQFLCHHLVFAAF